jgi:hypothetical protein
MSAITRNKLLADKRLFAINGVLALYVNNPAEQL